MVPNFGDDLMAHVVDFAIICALDVETNAVLKLFRSLKQHSIGRLSAI